MATRISQRELRNDNADVMRRIEAGESFIVTRRGEPVADLIPHRNQGADRLTYVPTDRLSELFDDLPAWNTPSWVDQQSALDQMVDDSVVDPWS